MERVVRVLYERERERERESCASLRGRELRFAARERAAFLCAGESCISLRERKRNIGITSRKQISLTT